MKRPTRKRDAWGTPEPLDVFGERMIAYRAWVGEKWYRRLWSWFSS
jgi:hypothetical protein